MKITATLQLRVHDFPKKIGEGTKVAQEKFLFGSREILYPLDLMLVEICVTVANCYVQSTVLTEIEALKQMRDLIEGLRELTDSYEKQLKDTEH